MRPGTTTAIRQYSRTAERQCRRTACSATIRRDGNPMARLRRQTAATIQWMAGPRSWQGRVACARPAAVQRAARVLAPGLRDAPGAAVRHYSQVLLLVLYGIEARPNSKCAAVRARRAREAWRVRDNQRRGDRKFQFGSWARAARGRSKARERKDRVARARAWGGRECGLPLEGGPGTQVWGGGGSSALPRLSSATDEKPGHTPRHKS